MHITRITSALQSFLTSNYPDCSVDVFQMTVPPDKKMGDICLNIFGAVKQLKTSPHVLGASLAEYFKQQDFILDVQVLGGFVNLFLTDDVYLEETQKWQLPQWGKRDETVIVDYMGPNIGKPLHIGHLCTPLFGQATINMLRLMGYTVIADMHQGDWGGIFGKLITGWKYFGDEKAFSEAPLKHLLDIYVKITEKIEGDESVDQECRDAFRLLSDGDEASVKLWQRFTDASLASVREVMSDFGAKPDVWIGESFYEGLPLPKLGGWPDLQADNTMSSVVEELVQSGIATKNDDESVGIVFDDTNKKEEIIKNKEGMVASNSPLEGGGGTIGKKLGESITDGGTPPNPLINKGESRTDSKNSSTHQLINSGNLGNLKTSPALPSCILQKRDGTHGYLASDLSAIKYRLRNWNPSKIMYFVDNRQALHFKQLFATAEKAWGYKEIELEQCSRASHPEGFEGKIETGMVGLNSELGTRSSTPRSLRLEENSELTFIHAANGFVSLPEGAMSTRHGRVIFLSDVVEESFDRVKAILVERGKELADADIRAVALGAIVYSFMAQDRERDWIFEWDKVLAFEGSSGPYLQYTYVRFAKMLQEFGYDKNTETPSETLPLTTYDKDLVLDILGFEDVLAQCAETYKFHLLIAHITTTARHLNALYVNTPKLRDSSPAERAMRMQIIAQTLEMIRYSCEIVSIPLPGEM